MKLRRTSCVLPFIFAAAPLLLLIGSCSAQFCDWNSGQVCGHNGQTYRNECAAWNNGQRPIAHRGGCGAACSTNGQVCDEEFDQTYPNECEALKAGVPPNWIAPGRCGISPRIVCNPSSGKVCVVETYTTYDNECAAENAGVSPNDYISGSCRVSCPNPVCATPRGGTKRTYCRSDDAVGINNRVRGKCSSSNTRSYSVRGAQGTYTFQEDDNKD